MSLPSSRISSLGHLELQITNCLQNSFWMLKKWNVWECSGRSSIFSLQKVISTPTVVFENWAKAIHELLKYTLEAKKITGNLRCTLRQLLQLKLLLVNAVMLCCHNSVYRLCKRFYNFCPFGCQLTSWEREPSLILICIPPKHTMSYHTFFVG